MPKVSVRVTTTAEGRPFAGKLEITSMQQPPSTAPIERSEMYFSTESSKLQFELPPGLYSLKVSEAQGFATKTNPQPLTILDIDQDLEIALIALAVTVQLSGIGDDYADARKLEVEARLQDAAGGSTLDSGLVSQTKPRTLIPPGPGEYRVLLVDAPKPFGLPSTPFKRVRVSADAPSPPPAIFELKTLPITVDVRMRGTDTRVAQAVVALVETSGRDCGEGTTSKDKAATLFAPASGVFFVELRSTPKNTRSTGERRIRVDVTSQGTQPSAPLILVEEGVEPKSSRLAYGVSWGVVLLVGLTGLILFWGSSGSDGRRSRALATLVLCGVLLLLTLINRERGFFEPVVGGDNRASTSRVAPAMWTVSLVWALSFLMFCAATDMETLETAVPDDYWDEYLILLGGPFAAFVLAKASTSWKVESGQLQKTTSPSASPVDIFTDDAGSTSLVDSQYLAFNVVALVYFWAALLFNTDDAGQYQLPDIPSQLLALTSSAALTYAASKALERNAPSITAIEPASARAGESVRISGRNFCPAGTEPGDVVTVSIDGVGAVPATPTDNRDTVAIVVPPGTPRGLRNLIVTTSAKISTEPGHLEVISDQPELLGFSEIVGRPGCNLFLIARGARSPLDRFGHSMIVAFDARRVPGELLLDGDVERIKVRVPRDLTASSVSVTIQSPRGVPSSPITVPIAQAPLIDSAHIKRGESPGDLHVEIDAFTVLGPDGGRGSTAVLVNGKAFDVTGITPVEESRERVVADGNEPQSGPYTVVLKDWLGRQAPEWIAPLE